MTNVKIYIIFLLTVCLTVSVFAQKNHTIEQFKESVKRRDNILTIDTKLKDNQRIDSLELSTAERDSIIFYQEKILAERSDYDDLKNRLAALEIYEFLGKRDISVFTADLPNSNIPLSTCSQMHFLLIEKINSANDILTKTGDKISDTSIDEFAKRNSVSIAEARQFLIQSAETDLLDADTKMDEIDKMDLSVLSSEQQQFYKQTLLDKYRAIYKQIYPDE